MGRGGRGRREETGRRREQGLYRLRGTEWEPGGEMGGERDVCVARGAWPRQGEEVEEA